MALNALGLGFIFTARDLASGVMNRVRTTFNKTATQTDKNSKRMSAAFAGIGLGLTGMIAGLVGLGVSVAAANQFGEFGKTLAGVGAVAKATNAEMRELEQSAISAGLATQFSPQEAAEGLQNLATAGLKAREATTALIPVLDLATGSLGQLGVAEAANAVVGTLNSYNQTAEQATQVTDKLLRITQLTNFQARDFEGGLAKAAAAGGVFNQSLDDTLVIMGLLRNRNIDASASSTAVREAFRRLAADKLAAKALKEVGVSAFDATGKMKPVIDTTLELAEATKDLTEEERNKIIVNAFGARGLLAFSAITKAQTTVMRDGKQVTLDVADSIAHLRGEIGKADGTANEFKETLLETFAGQKQLLRGVLQTFSTVMGEGFAKVFKPFVSIFVQGLTAVTTALSNMPKGLKTALAAIFLAGSAFLAGGGAIVMFGAAVALLLPALKIIAITFGVVSIALLPLIAGVGAAVLAFVGFRQAYERNIGGIGDKMSNAFEKVKLGFLALSQLLSEGRISGPVAKDISKAENEGLLNFVSRLFGIVERIKNFFAGVADGFGQWIGVARPTIDAFMKAMEELGKTVGFVTDNIDHHMEGMKFDDAGRRGERFGFLLGKTFELIVKVLTRVIKFTDAVIKNWEQIKSVTKWVAGVVGSLWAFRAASAAVQLSTVALKGALYLTALVQKAYNAAIWIGAISTKQLSIATALAAAKSWLLRAAQLATSAAAKAVALAQGLYNLALSRGTAAQGLFTAASLRSAIASGRARIAALAGAGGMTAFARAAGAAAAAVGSVMLAMDQADKLKAETGGLGVWGTASEMWKRGTFDPFEAVDAYQNERAREKARFRGARADKTEVQTVPTQAQSQPFVAGSVAPGTLPSAEEIMSSLERGAARQRPAQINLQPRLFLDGEELKDALSGDGGGFGTSPQD